MRRLSFYLRMAAQNLAKNHRFYLPYILCCIGTSAMFYIMGYLTQDDMIKEMTGAVYVQTIMWLGVIVIAVFSVFIMLYTNSFIMKRRRRELGLYNILGMEKRHIATLMFFETLMVSAISIAGGLAVGILFSKLMILILAQILRFGVPMGFSVNQGAVTLTVVWFLAVFALCLISNIGSVLKASPIELLHSTSKGEREPKTKWIMAQVGLLSLAGGYYIAITTADPISALSLFFVAVMLVIIGTYCLFTAGSIALLKLLRRNKKFYYRTGPFTAVSGLIYRMKQNAVGLANICILSTMVLVTISSTVCLYVGIGSIMKSQYPSEIEISTPVLATFEEKLATDEDISILKQLVDKTIQKHEITITKEECYTELMFTAAKTENGYSLDENNYLDTASGVVLAFLTAEDYNALTGESVTLEKNEVLSYSSLPDLPGTVELESLTFQVKEHLKQFPFSGADAMVNMINFHYLVVADQDVLQAVCQIQADAYGESRRSEASYVIGLDLEGTADEKIAVYEDLKEKLMELSNNGLSYYNTSRQSNTDDIYQLYGSFLFLGIFLGAVFMMAAVLIIYYKQVSEGYEDRERFIIMQKVGMDAKTVKKSIRSQVLMVFFLPLLTAGIHILFAFPMISRLLKLFSLNDTALFAICTVATLLVFSIIYVIVYSMTAKTYYKIVKG